MQQGPEALVVGQPQRGVVAVEPMHDGLQREAGVEASGAGVAVDVALRLRGGLGDGVERSG